MVSRLWTTTVSSKFVNTKNYGHQGSFLGGLSCNAGFAVIQHY